MTLESVANQSVPYDIVLVYPLKNKETKRLAKEFGAQSVDDPGGMSAAVNAGIARTKSYHKYITWIGDDDLLTPGSLDTSFAALEDDSRAVVAYGYCDYIDAQGNHLFTNRAGRLAPWLMTWGPDLVPMPGLLMRSSALKEAGEFDVNNKYCMDLDMLLRLRKLGKFINTGRALAAFRWHATSTTVSNRKAAFEEAQTVKRHYLAKWLRPLAPLWEYPVKIATYLAVWRVNRLAAR
jgi:GT2 family glycosyltransferase